MKTMTFLTAFLLGGTAGLIGQSNVDPVRRFAWAATLGWVDARAGDGVQGAVLRGDFASGYVWSANAGWINWGDGTPVNGTSYANTSGADFGVNHAGGGRLRGLAWGANLGWIVFGDSGDPRVDLATGALSGYAWMANAGWLNLAGLATLGSAPLVALDPSEPGTPAEETAPPVAIAPASEGGVRLTFRGVPGRAAVLQASDSLTPPVCWLEVGSLVPDADGVLSFVDLAGAEVAHRFYRIVIP